MNAKTIVIMALLIFFGKMALAEDVITFIRLDNKMLSSKKPYLAGVWRNEGYISIRAMIENSGNKTCIEPINISNVGSYFVDRESTVVITANIYGLPSIDSKQEIPIANFKWNGSNRFCASELRPAVLLAPLTPTTPLTDYSSPSPTPDQPLIVINIKSFSSDREKVSTLVESLLEISSVYATGGAANTVAGFSKLIAGPIVDNLSAQYSKFNTSKSHETFKIELTWEEIAAGLQAIQFQLVSTELEGGLFNGRAKETVGDAIYRVRTRKTQYKKLLDFNILLDTRRSVFFEDADAQKTPFIAYGDKIDDKRVLNYPKKEGGIFRGSSSSVYQTLNEEVPSFASRLATNAADACARLVNKVIDAGFNKIDTAIIVAAALNEAKPDWKIDPNFVCIEDQELIATIRRIYPEAISPKLPTPTETQYQNGLINASRAEYLNNIRRALYAAGQSRDVKLSAIFSESSTIPNQTFPVGEEEVSLRNITIHKVGCFSAYNYGNFPNVGTMLAMIVVAKNKKGERFPLALTFSLDKNQPGGTPMPSSSFMGVADLSNPGNDDLLVHFNNAKFGSQSVCAGAGETRAPIAFLTQLVKD